MEKIELNGKSLAPRELTVEEIETVLLDLSKGEMHPVESFTKEIAVSAIAAAISVGVEVDDLKKLTPSQLQQLFREVELVNPSIAEQITDLGGLARKLIAEDLPEDSPSTGQSTPSDETAAGSSPPDTSR